MFNKLENKIIKILIAESQELILLGLCKLMEDHHSLNIVGTTDNPDVAFDIAIRHKPDVILFDLLLNNSNCIEYIPYILKACPQSKILALSNNNDDELTHLDALRAGVSGIFFKHQRTELLYKAINFVSIGEVWFDNHLTKLLCQSQVNQPLLAINIADDKIQQPCLTDRECHIACLTSKGLSAKKVGEHLFISEKTVRNQLTMVYEKLAVNGQVDLCLKAPELNFCLLPNQSRDRDNCPRKKG